jgi:hypothetical protein
MHGHITDLVVAVKEYIVPYLPFLIEGASKGIGKSAGEITVKEIWGKLEPKLNAKNDAKQAAMDIVAKPDSEARKAVFQEELETLLIENPDLVQELTQISVTGAGNQVIGLVSGGTVLGHVTGDVTLGK